MKIGLYFGTFNPIHIGHLIIANHMAEHSDLDQIWLVVTPHNPHKQKNTLLDDYHRLHLVHLATEDFPKIKGNPHLTVIGHITDENSGANLVTRAGQQIELTAQGFLVRQP